MPDKFAPKRQRNAAKNRQAILGLRRRAFAKANDAGRGAEKTRAAPG